MSDPLRTESSRALDAVADADRDAKIEQLLVVGLDHYFSADYEQAINVWTRALFLDRSHAKARAYIERARSALAEQQRESEELLQNGFAAFQRGEADEARRLLQTAMRRGAPSDEALAVLDRLNRLQSGGPLQRPLPPGRREPPASAEQRADTGTNLWHVLWLAAVAIAVGGIIVVAPTVEWRALTARDELTPAPVPRPSSESRLPLPLRGETALARARAFAAGGHLREALAALEEVRATDQHKDEADQMRARIQRELIALTPARPVVAGRGKADGPLR
jgi:tetratricopeptide (TPR) repeat protein